MSTHDDRKFEWNVRLQTQPSDNQLWLSDLDWEQWLSVLDLFLIQFRLIYVMRRKTYVADLPVPVLTPYEFQTNVDVWLPKHCVMLYDGGACLSSTLFNILAIPIELHRGVSLDIATAAGLAGISRSSIVVDLNYEFTVNEVELDHEDNGEVDRVILESMEAYQPQPIPATKASIEALEKVRVQQGLLDCVKECIVCMQEFEVGSEVTRMPCSHVYHGDCIIKWLETSHFCPLCRYPMPHDEIEN